GLTARQLVVHVAAQESLLAQLVGTPTLGAVQETDIDARTDAALVQFADHALDDVVAAWQMAVDANRRWALEQPTDTTEWRGIRLPGRDVLIVRAFETWVHAEDLRRVGDLPPRAPEPRHLALMSDLAGRSLGLSLKLAGRERPGRTARLVLTGDGGGEWLVGMGGDQPGPTADVTITADAIEWCMLVGDRVTPADLAVEIDGDRSLADDLLASASVLATL
ncbi:MAG: maleylpyruvate isomerase family mycothiol-dependent enzyme, partial [Acidimicrobiia bacterium]